MAGENFPNGFESWSETHFEVVDFITRERMKEPIEGVIGVTQESNGTVGCWELATKWTNEFELLNKGDDWNHLDYYDEVEKFCVTKNKE